MYITYGHKLQPRNVWGICLIAKILACLLLAAVAGIFCLLDIIKYNTREPLKLEGYSRNSTDELCIL